IYSEVEAVCKEMLRESKRILKSLYGSWRTLTEKYKQKRIAHTQYEEERNKLRAEAWRELEALKEKYDRAFGELERRIEAYLRARKPLLTKHVFSAFKLLNGPPFMWVKGRVYELVGLVSYDGHANDEAEEN
ncbi:MAG: hypothetical protein QXH61_01750, partial [Candidatus Nezhaarchaeales archaeon]